MELSLGKVLLCSIFFILTINLQIYFACGAIGVNYGMQGDNLPSPSDVISLYRQENVPLLRLFDPNHGVLEALRGSGIGVALGVANGDVPNIANDLNVAKNWVAINVAPYYNDVKIRWITLGNEMVPFLPGHESIPGAMENINQALHLAGLTEIKVSTAVHTVILGASYPPSVADFTTEACETMKAITTWLANTNNPLFVNAYPYYAYVSQPAYISLAYAQFSLDHPEVIDGQYKYFTLFEAMIDSFYAALEKHGGANVPIIVGETGWPSAGNGEYTSVANAQNYNQGLINKMKQNGTPRRPSSLLDIFIFAMFNENQKSAGFEQNWGIHYPNKQPIYPLSF